MKNRHRLLLLSALSLSAAMLPGCSSTKPAALTTYDLGSLQPSPAPTLSMPAAASAMDVPARIAPITVADVSSASWLDSQMMFYRLRYDNDLQPRPYATSRWSMPPPQLLSQRIKARLAQAGGVVLSGADGAINIPMLRVEADDFSQRFATAGQSDVHVAVRASVLNGRALVAQKSFEQVRPAPSADAAGGAAALATATDAMISEMMAWLATLPVKK